LRVFTSLDDVAAAAGQDLGSTDWIAVEQDRVDAFADATGDHQWIHVDVERAKDGPFGGTIAHGYLTLSLVPWLGSQIFSLDTPGAKLNYGVNKVRFPSPLLVGKRVRGHAAFGDVTDLPTGKQLIIRYTVEIEDEPKPACVAETVVLLLEA
jgi:acyl dehydratase